MLYLVTVWDDLAMKHLVFRELQWTIACFTSLSCFFTGMMNDIKMVVKKLEDFGNSLRDTYLALSRTIREIGINKICHGLTVEIKFH